METWEPLFFNTIVIILLIVDLERGKDMKHRYYSAGGIVYC